MGPVLHNSWVKKYSNQFKNWSLLGRAKNMLILVSQSGGYYPLDR